VFHAKIGNELGGVQIQALIIEEMLKKHISNKRTILGSIESWPVRAEQRQMEI
jgi:hypothetical protein